MYNFSCNMQIYVSHVKLNQSLHYITSVPKRKSFVFLSNLTAVFTKCEIESSKYLTNFFWTKIDFSFIQNCHFYFRKSRSNQIYTCNRGALKVVLLPFLRIYVRQNKLYFFLRTFNE